MMILSMCYFVSLLVLVPVTIIINSVWVLLLHFSSPLSSLVSLPPPLFFRFPLSSSTIDNGLINLQHGLPTLIPPSPSIA